VSQKYLIHIRNLPYFNILLIYVFSITLVSCQTTSPLSHDLSSKQAQHYLDQAKDAQGNEQVHWLLKASESLLENQLTSKSIKLLESIDTQTLSDNNAAYYHSLLGMALFQAKIPEQSLRQFNQVERPELLTMPQAIQFHKKYAEVLELLDYYYDSAIQRIKLSSLISDQLDTEENVELLWQSLMQVNNLEIYINSLNSMIVNGWLKLANIAKKYANEPNILLKKLELWHNRFNTHPANNQLPIDMARAESARSYHPQQIAILLPETGKFSSSADQIRDGFLTALFQASPDRRPKIVFYDTAATDDIKALYQRAIDDGASFVVGPLSRPLVEQLSQIEYFPVPILAINRFVSDRLLADNFYQFGLPVEDEARQAANRAWQDGREKALVLMPTGAIGDRTSKAFTEEFERLGGSVQQVVHYGDSKDYSRAVQELLGVDKSIERFNKLRQLFRMKAHHEARRRQDSDFIFFKASTTQARIIKPFIDFYFAQDLAVYSTSSIYYGKEDIKNDSDLNNVIFCDIPWLLSKDNELINKRNEISKIWPNSVKSHKARLFALGYDLQALIPELNKLKNFSAYHLSGLSGNLTVDESGHVNRELSWAKFVKGKAVVNAY